MKNSKDANREKFKVEKSAERVKPINTTDRSRVNQRIRNLDPDDYDDAEFETFQKFHRSR